MPVRGHDPLPIDDFNGLWARGKGTAYDGTLTGDLSCPPDHFVIANNIRYFNKGFGNREPFRRIAFGGKGGNFLNGIPRRFYVFRLVGDTQDRFLVLSKVGADSILSDSNTIIYTWAGLDIPDISVLSAANRIYITPHDRQTGIPTLNVLVYNGTSCREAAGATPTTGPLGIQAHNFNRTDANGSGGGYTTPTVPPNSNVGYIPAGKRLFAYVFETDTGFLTAPGPNNGVSPNLTPAFTLYSVTNSVRKVDAYNVPVGPAGTIARRILATRTIPKYDGNQKNWELFFVPNGRIPNNTIVGISANPAITLNFFDTDLVDSAEYLLNQRERIPSGVSFFYFNARMLLFGQYNTTLQPTNDAIILASKQAQPESMDTINGIISVYPDDVNGSVKSGVDYHGILHAFKSARSHAIQDTGGDPVDWSVTLIEAGIGTECHGVATILDAKGQSQERFIILDKSGALQFAGVFSERPITYKIDDVWALIRRNWTTNIQAQMQVCVDPVAKRIYVMFPNDTSSIPSPLSGCLLMGDYLEGHPQAPFSSLGGLTWDIMKWSIWYLSQPIISIAMGSWQQSSNIPSLYFIEQSTTPGVEGSYQISQFVPPATGDYVSGDATVDPVNTLAIMGPAAPDQEGMINHLGEIRSKMLGTVASGSTFNWSVQNDDGSTLYGVPTAVPVITPNGTDTTRPLNAVAERFSMVFQWVSANNVGDYFLCKKIVFYMKTLWSMRREGAQSEAPPE